MYFSFKDHDGISDEIKTRVQFLIEYMGYSTEIKIPADAYKDLMAKEKVLAIVQDADRLDSIGAIGIGRAYTFGGNKNEPIYGEESLRAASQPEFPGCCSEVSGMVGCSTMIFFNKLFHIEGRMKTVKGKQLARGRHNTMEKFIMNMFKNDV